MLDANRKRTIGTCLQHRTEVGHHGFTTRPATQPFFGCDLPDRRRADDKFGFRLFESSPKSRRQASVTEEKPDKCMAIEEDFHPPLPIDAVLPREAARRK